MSIADEQLLQRSTIGVEGGVIDFPLLVAPLAERSLPTNSSFPSAASLLRGIGMEAVHRREMVFRDRGWGTIAARPSDLVAGMVASPGRTDGCYSTRPATGAPR